QQRDIAERVDEKRLQRRLQEGCENKEAPNAVDDAGNAREQLDRNSDRTAQPYGAKLGEEYRDRGGHKRSVDRGKRPEFFRHRIPALGDKKVQTERAEGRPGAEEQRKQDRAKDAQNGQRAGTGQDAKELIDGADLAQPLDAFLLVRRGQCTILQRDINQGWPPGGRHKRLSSPRRSGAY